MIAILFCILLQESPLQQPTKAAEQGRSHQNGPLALEVRVMPEINPYNVISTCFQAIERQLIVEEYAESGILGVRGDLNFELPASTVSSRIDSTDSIEFAVSIDGATAPSGRYRYQVNGDLGDMLVAQNVKRKLTVSHAFKSFADQPKRARSKNANLRSFRSLALRKLKAMEAQILESGDYRFVYAGTGHFKGRIVDIVRIFKPQRGRRVQSKDAGPMPIQKLWTFWYDGGYELWVYNDNNLPAALFYTNVDDNIFANLELDYDREHLVRRILVQNNSVGFEGQGELILDYREDRVLRGLRLTFEAQKGADVEMDLKLDFESGDDPDQLRFLPPFGYKKVNADHLKLLLTTQIAGGLLQLQQHGVNLKNFSF